MCRNQSKTIIFMITWAWSKRDLKRQAKERAPSYCNSGQKKKQLYANYGTDTNVTKTKTHSRMDCYYFKCQLYTAKY